MECQNHGAIGGRSDECRGAFRLLRIRRGRNPRQAIVEFGQPACERGGNQVSAGGEPIEDALTLEGAVLFEHAPAEPAETGQQRAHDQRERENQPAERTESRRGLHGLIRGGWTPGL